MDREEPRTVPTERDANARLMAKAPELRDALRKLCASWEWNATPANASTAVDLRSAVMLLDLIDKENQ